MKVTTAGFLAQMLIGGVLDTSSQSFTLVLHLIVVLLLASGIAARQIGHVAPS